MRKQTQITSIKQTAAGKDEPNSVMVFGLTRRTNDDL
jgi:hypothetical protein